jgi:glycosyltransferase involved in cell wall biosynthesis
MRVLMVSAHGDDPTAGGVERLLASLGGQLSARGAEVAFLQAFPARVQVMDVERTVLYESDWRDDRTRRMKNHLGDVLARPRAVLEQALAHHRPDVVHTHSLPGISTSVWESCRRLGLPVVHSLHDYYLLCPRVTLMRPDGQPCRPNPLLCGLRTRRLARWAGAVTHLIGVSQYVLDLHAPFFPEATRHLIRHPMPAAARPSRPVPSIPGVLGYIGSLERIKGVHLLLDAAPQLERLGMRLSIAGDGRMRDEVSAAARSRRNVEWKGSLLGGRKDAFFADCDLGVVPSVWAEPGGPTFTMIEWLAAGRPVLVSDRGGLGEVAGRYGGSIAIEPTVEGIVHAVSELGEEGRWREILGALEPDRADVEAQDWVERHEAIYRSVVV